MDACRFGYMLIFDWTLEINKEKRNILTKGMFKCFQKYLNTFQEWTVNDVYHSNKAFNHSATMIILLSSQYFSRPTAICNTRLVYRSVIFVTSIL